jgi:O-antigen ligase
LNLTIEGARQSGSFLLDGTQRLNATFADPNQFGFYIATMFLVMAGAVCGYLFIEKPVRWRTASSYLLLAVSAAVAVIGTYSRSTWLLATFGVIVLASLLGRTFWTRRRAVVAGVATVVALGLASPLIASRLGSSEPGNLKSTQVHEHTMSLAVKLAAHHPFTGVGLGGYGHYANQPPLISSSVSTFLTVAAELGLPGLILLIAAIIVTSLAAVRSVLRSRSAERALLAGFVAAFVALAAANTLGEVWMDDFQWALFGVLVAVTAQPLVALDRLPFLKRNPIDDGPGTSATEQAQVVA